jgi:ABC-type phosphate/phosphonate transport system substrate-binding protein
MLKYTKNFNSGKVIDAGFLLIIFVIIFTLLPKPVLAQETLRLGIMPLQSEERTREIFQPMSRYIQHLTGQKVELITYPNFISYWSETQKGDTYDIVFDAANFIDYRNKSHDFTVIARQPGTISISLVVPEDSFVFDPEELIGKKISTLGPPSLTAINIYNMYDNPTRQPTIVEADNTQHVVAMMREGSVDAGMIPTPMVSAIMAAEGGINVVTTTEPVPGMGISVSPNVTSDIREKLVKGFLEADKTPEGQKMLEGTSLNPFEKTSNQDYFGFSEMMMDQL